MKTWNVKVVETLTRIVPVEAEDVASAEEIVRGRYNRGEIVLVSEDMCCADIIAEQQGICPLCGAEIEYAGKGSLNNRDNMLPWTCPSCGARGMESYSRHFSGHWAIEEGGAK